MLAGDETAFRTVYRAVQPPLLRGPGKPTAKPDSSGKGGGKDSSTSGS